MADKEIVQIKTKELYDLLSIKDIDILSAYRLLCLVYCVIWNRYNVQHAKTPEATALARWSLEAARDTLRSALRKMNLCDLDKDLVKYIANNFEFYEYGE